MPGCCLKALWTSWVWEVVLMSFFLALQWAVSWFGFLFCTQQPYEVVWWPKVICLQFISVEEAPASYCNYELLLNNIVLKFKSGILVISWWFFSWATVPDVFIFVLRQGLGKLPELVILQSEPPECALWCLGSFSFFETSFHYIAQTLLELVGSNNPPTSVSWYLAPQALAYKPSSQLLGVFFFF